MRIELVGGLGVGKSTLCHALADIGFHCIYEDLQTNPFLADCFKDPENFRFPSQMWFVLSKYYEIKKHEKPDAVNVLDQSVLNVCAYTNMLFGSSDPYAMHIINQCFHYMEQQTGQPDLLINLWCSPEEQMRRIRGRNRDHEKGVTLEYVTDLQNEINGLVDLARANGYRVLDIDTEAVFLPENVGFARQLANHISHMFGMELNLQAPQQQSLQPEAPASVAPMTGWTMEAVPEQQYAAPETARAPQQYQATATVQQTDENVPPVVAYVERMAAAE